MHLSRFVITIDFHHSYFTLNISETKINAHILMHILIKQVPTVLLPTTYY